MNDHFLTLFSKFGVIHRQEDKNYPQELGALIRLGLVQKIRQKKEVYYRLTVKALPVLDDYRQLLFSLLQLRAKLHPRSQVYSSLLGDLRLFSESNKQAREFLFLGDWQLRRPPTPLQLELAYERYFSEKKC